MKLPDVEPAPARPAYTAGLPPASRATPAPRPLARAFRGASLVASVVVMAAAVAVVAGWWFDLPLLRTLLPAAQPVRANSAVALLLSGASLVTYRVERWSDRLDQLMRLFGGAAILIGVVTLAESLAGWDLDLARLLGRPGAAREVAAIAAVATPISLILLNLAPFVANAPGRYGVAQALILAMGLLAAISTISFLIGVDSFLGIAVYTSMPFGTSLLLLLLAAAFLMARPDEGLMNVVTGPDPGGVIARQLLPAGLLLPVLLAWLSWQGERLALYGPAFAMTLYVVLAIGSVTYVVWYGAVLLRRLEDQRLVAEAQRLQSEERLRRAVTQAPVPMIIHQGNDILFMSRGWTDASGYTVDDTPTLAAWTSRAQASSQEAVKAYLDSLARITETTRGGESTILAKSGEKRVWEFSTTPLGDLSGERRTLLTLAVDITERKRAEAELLQMNEQLEQRIAERTQAVSRANEVLQRQSEQLRNQAALLDLVRDGILVRDLKGKIVYWSAGAAAMYGWTREEAVGTQAYALLKPESPRPLADIEQEALEAGVWEGELTHLAKSGARLFVESRWTATGGASGSARGFFEINRDITARKQAEASLRESELRFRAVSETANEGIVSVDESGIVRYWNPGAARMFGRTADEIVGQPVALIMPERLRGSHNSGLKKYLITREATLIGTTTELTGLRKNGSEFPIELSLSSWQTTKGLLFSGIVRDITERRNAARAIEAKTAELERSNQELEQFAYVASHDLQEPLRMVSNYTQMLARRYKDKLDADANEFIEFAVDGAKRMQALIHDLLEFARVGTRGKEFKPVPGGQVAREAVANLTGAIEEAGADVVIDPLPTLACDATQLAQVFQNLIGNAIKFRRPDARPIIHVSARRSAPGWVLSVHDNGIGIEPRHFDRIFQMFQRLHGRSEYAGTGIGLALCKKIVERHGGRIKVESEPGKGTTFSFTIPDTGAGRHDEAAAE